MYSIDLTSEDIEDKIESYDYCIDQIEGIISSLKIDDEKYNQEYIRTLKDLKADFKYEIEGWEEEKSDKEEEEQKQYKEEMREMNYQFERSRL